MNSIKPDVSKLIPVQEIILANQRLKEVIYKTPLIQNYALSKLHKCAVYLKREDMQVVRSFKIRGAYNKMRGMDEAQLKNGVICASAGNHAQGVAFACHSLGVKATIYMPLTTPKQKINKVRHFGGDNVEIILIGDSFDDSNQAAMDIARKKGLAFIHPFNDVDIIAGQGTVGIEILESASFDIDYLIVSVGGGGLISGVGSYFNRISPNTKIIGVEASGAPAMKRSLQAGKPIKLRRIDSFADGIAVKNIGDLTFEICKEVIDKMVLVPEGKICSTILQLYNDEAIVCEPAGANVIAALEEIGEEILGKNVVCLLSGGNNDITRTQEIRERALLFEGKKHYFIIRFPQRAGALREFLDVLGPNDDITHFEYTKKTNRESGPALVGIELKVREDYDSLVSRMEEAHINFHHINKNPMLFEMLI